LTLTTTQAAHLRLAARHARDGHPVERIVDARGNASAQVDELEALLTCLTPWFPTDVRAERRRPSMARRLRQIIAFTNTMGRSIERLRQAQESAVDFGGGAVVKGESFYLCADG
jgi:hypothetical protein